MASDARFVLDTNVIVSALLLRQSATRQAFDVSVKRGKLLISLDTISELNEVLSRQELNRYISEEERLQFLASLVREALLIEVTDVVYECRDPKDNRFLALALSGNATCIVSGDKDLLALHPFRGIPIFSPRSFLDVFQGQT